MSQTQRDAIDHLLRTGPFDLGGDVSTQRPLLEQMLTAHPLPDDVHSVPGELGQIPVIEVSIAGQQPHGVVLHFHGGGFALGSAAGSVGFAADLARRTHRSAVTVEYRLAPEHPYPAAPQDALRAYEALLEREGGAAGIVVTGESAGATIALTMLIAARDRGLELPAAAAVFSPMSDLSASGASYRTKADADPNITAEAIRTRVADYLRGTAVDPADPAVSPTFADLSGLPPLLVQAGSHEVLLDDAVRLAARAAADDVAVSLEVTPEVSHVFQAFAAILEEGDVALERAARFLREDTRTATGSPT